MNKPQDRAAAAIVFGVELETIIPQDCGIEVGAYHGGRPVTMGKRVEGERELISAPHVGPRDHLLYWRADNDASIRTTDRPSFKGCEFVSPKLSGEVGIQKLDEFVSFAKAVGGEVNGSCGCHVTVSIPSVIGTSNADAIAAFVRKVVRIANRHTWAIYAQTGTGRHESQYCRPPGKSLGEVTNELLRVQKHGDGDGVGKAKSAAQSICGRGMINLLKAFPNRTPDSCIEFRAFAGTLNRFKLMHHVATVLGICRKAHIAKAVPYYQVHPRLLPHTAQDAMFRLWRQLGWVEGEAGNDIALGLFGLHHEQFNRHSNIALKMAAKFERRFPKSELFAES